jgi:uncharacterized SAM-dependent methyltransferase
VHGWENLRDHEPVCHVSYPEPIHLIELSSGSSAKTRYLLEAPVTIIAYRKAA